jgi:hypothetical protein
VVNRFFLNFNKAENQYCFGQIFEFAPDFYFFNCEIFERRASGIWRFLPPVVLTVGSGVPFLKCNGNCDVPQINLQFNSARKSSLLSYLFIQFVPKVEQQERVTRFSPLIFLIVINKIAGGRSLGDEVWSSPHELLDPFRKLELLKHHNFSGAIKLFDNVTELGKCDSWINPGINFFLV